MLSMLKDVFGDSWTPQESSCVVVRDVAPLVRALSVRRGADRGFREGDASGRLSTWFGGGCMNAGYVDGEENSAVANSFRNCCSAAAPVSWCGKMYSSGQRSSPHCVGKSDMSLSVLWLGI